MSAPLHPVLVRLPADVYKDLKKLAASHDHDLGEEARQILTEAIMGKSYALKIVYERLGRAIKNDNDR